MKKSFIVLWHLAYWLMYSLVVLLVWAGSNAQHSNPPQLEGWEALKVSLYIVFLSKFSILCAWPGVIGFYTFYLLLFDKFLTRKKIGSLLLSILFICLLTPVLLESLLLAGGSTRHVPPSGAILGMGVFMAALCLAHGILGIVLKGFITWYGDIKIKMELNKKNYEMELALIKAQVNPHFLFNTINNIDVLILKDPPKASAYLNKLSDMLRFMLYETKTEKIELQKELAYIEKYIGLQKIRTTNADYVSYTLQGDAGNLRIEPMLLIPFIENAFKHAENKRVENAVKVNIHIEKDSLAFDCENAYSATNSVKPEHGGLGNELIQRRLALLYPGKHSFEASHKNGLYKVKLLLSLAH